MPAIKEITVFTNGDSSKLSTWSNVPYFFTETLLSKKIKVNRVDISPSHFLKKLYNSTVYPVLRIIKGKSTYDYFRSLTHFVNVRNRIKKAIKQYPNADAHIFLTFSFSSASLTDKPIIQFCDWTYDHYFNYFMDREPNYFEQQCIEREDSQIEGSDLVVPLFPGIAEYMKKRYQNANIQFLGNVINSLYDVSENDMIKIKENSNSLLFVGNEKYIDGARALIGAFEKIKLEHPNLILNIIGLNNSDFEKLPADVFCHGYLDKGKDDDRELYYKLFREAKIFINTTPKWGGFSATIEAMYFFIPVIISPYDEFVETFGKDIDFGRYSEQNTPFFIEENIIEILNSTSYKSFCSSAHNAVKDYTWSSCIDKIIGRIENIIKDS